MFVTWEKDCSTYYFARKLGETQRKFSYGGKNKSPSAPVRN